MRKVLSSKVDRDESPVTAVQIKNSKYLIARLILKLQLLFHAVIRMRSSNEYEKKK